MRILPRLITSPGYFYFEWLIIRAWTINTFGISIDADFSTVRFGFGFILPYLRVFIGWPILPYNVWKLVSFLERKEVESPEEFEEIVVSDTGDE